MKNNNNNNDIIRFNHDDENKKIDQFKNLSKNIDIGFIEILNTF